MQRSPHTTSAPGVPGEHFSRCLFALIVAAGIDGTAFSADAAPAWELAWSDEFAAGVLEADNWNIELMPDPHNQELQYYTDRPANSRNANVRVADGMLVIEARRENHAHRRYTSARINTRGKQEFAFGRFEARMRLPAATGMWPAFWLLGANIDQVGWPACGEIDIMEGKGRLPNWTSGALNRGPAPDRNLTTWKEYVLPEGDFHEQWHVFALEWTPGRMRWFVDDVLFQEVTRPQGGDPAYWPYDNEQPFFLILNLAVGGHFDAPHEPPDPMDPQQLLVDWVRVYRDAAMTGDPPG